MTKNILLGNWKMNKTLKEAEAYVQEVKDQIVNERAILAVPDLFIPTLMEALKDSPLEIAAQNAYFELEGAYTGETSPQALADLGVKYVLVGHSERREIFNETDEMINKKVLRLLELGIHPVLCIGENLNEREQNEVDITLHSQLEIGLYNVDEDQAKNIIIAYEPVWAIGTGETATPEQANEACGIIRTKLADMFSHQVAEEIPVTYGGSVNVDNVEDLLDQGHIDGALVGGTSLDPQSFIQMSKKVASYD